MPTAEVSVRRPRAGVLCATRVLALAGLVVATAAGAEVTSPPLESLTEVLRLDRRALEQGRAVDVEVVTVVHDPSWERLVVQEGDRCIAVDAAGIDSPLPPGLRVRLNGFTGFARGGPVVVLPRFTRLGGRADRVWTRADPGRVVAGSGIECLELRARVRGARQLDSEHVSVGATADGHEIEGIVDDIPNSILLKEGDEVVLRGPVEALPTASSSVSRLRIYLQGGGSYQRIGEVRHAVVPPDAPQQPAPLTRLLEVKMLSVDQAARGLPVRVRGVVIGASPQGPVGGQEIVLQDAECGLYATTEMRTAAASLGSLVEIDGRTAPGGFAPIVVYSSLRVLGLAPLPRALAVERLVSRLSAQTENVRAVVNGVLRPHAADFAVATPDGELPLFFFSGDPASLQHLVDSEVEVHGAFAVIHRARRVVGYRLLVESPAQVVVRRPPAGGGESWPVARLFAYWPSGRPLHRVATRGVVTGVFHPGHVYLDDGSAGVLCETDDLPAVGTTVAASGFLPASGPEHRLTRVRIRELGAAAAPVPAPLLTLEQLLGGDQDGRLLRVVGRLRERTRSMGREMLTLEADQRTFSAVLELPTPVASVESLRIGSELRVTGVGQIDWDRSRVPPRARAVRVLLRSPADVELLRAAPWWTRGRILAALTAVLALALVSLVWLASLRGQVRQQTMVIRRQMERLTSEAEERERARKRLEASLEEQRVLLREVHHRVKNNLQAIIHLTEAERDRLADAQARSSLAGLSEKARAMALVYEQVYQSSSLAQVDMDAYLHALGERLLEAHADRREIALAVEAAGVTLDVARAMPCGLIVNELVTNALKYAFPSGLKDRGCIEVRLAETAGVVRLVVSDDGVGLPARDARRSGSLGLQLVELWATHQLGGRMELSSVSGTVFTLEFDARQ